VPETREPPVREHVPAPRDVATLRVAGKSVVAEGVLVLELAAPDGGRLRDWTPGSHVDLVLPNGLIPSSWRGAG